MDTAGRSVAGVGDVDGDGLDDVVVGASHNGPELADAYGAADLVLGAQLGSTRLVDLEDAAVVLLGDFDGQMVGRRVAALGDVTGDGLAGFAVTERDAGVGQPHVLVVSGAAAAAAPARPWDAVVASIEVLDADDPVAGVGDLDGRSARRSGLLAGGLRGRSGAPAAGERRISDASGASGGAGGVLQPGLATRSRFG